MAALASAINSWHVWAWAFTGLAQIMNLWVSLVGCSLGYSMGMASKYIAPDRGGSYFCSRGLPSALQEVISWNTQALLGKTHLHTPLSLSSNHSEAEMLLERATGLLA